MCHGCTLHGCDGVGRQRRQALCSMIGVLLEVVHRLGASLRCGRDNATNLCNGGHKWFEHLASKAMQRDHGQCARACDVCKIHITFHSLTHLQLVRIHSWRWHAGDSENYYITNYLGHLHATPSQLNYKQKRNDASFKATGS